LFFEKSAQDALAAIEEKGGSAFKSGTTTSRVSGTTTGSQLSGSLYHD
jgi:hypothetical protein